jgi:fucose permease
MSTDQKNKLLQGVVFGLFFQFIGWKMREWTLGANSVKVSGTIAIVMGCVIFAWGCSHLVAAKNLRREWSALGMLSVVGLAILWWMPARGGRQPSAGQG